MHILTDLGIRHFEKKEYEAALGYFQRSLKIDSTSAWNHFNVATTLTELGQLKESLEEVRIALTLDPKFEDAQELQIGILQMQEQEDENK